MLLSKLDFITSITSSEPFPVWQASRRLFAESTLIKSNFPCVSTNSTGFAGVRESAAEPSCGRQRSDEKTNDQTAFDFIKIIDSDVEIAQTGRWGYPNRHDIP